MSIAVIIGIIGGLFGLIGLVTVAVIVVRSNIATTTATLWQGEAAALKNRNERLTEDTTKLEKTVEDLKEQYKILEGLKSGTVEITALTKEVISLGRRISDSLDKTNEKIDNLSKTVARKRSLP